MEIPELPKHVEQSVVVDSKPISHDPTFGAPSQRINRAGADRMILTVTAQNLYGHQAAEIDAILKVGTTEIITCAVQQPMVTTSTNGSGTATGSTLSVSGTGTILPGQYVSIVSGGKRYLHQVAAASGGTLTVVPPCRVSGSVTVETAPAKISGFTASNQYGAAVNTAKVMALSFSIREAQ